MLRIIRNLILIAIILTNLPQVTIAQDEINRYIVGFENKIDTALIQKYQGEVLHTFETIHAATVKIPKSQIQNLLKYENVLYIEEDEKLSAQQQRIDWGVEKVKAEQAWSNDLTGSGVKIAILDSGIDENHPDLEFKKGESFVEYTSSIQDDNGHGTHVAGIIAARNNFKGTIGVAPNAELYIAKVLDSEGNGFQSDVLKGIEWAMKEKVDIINISVGGIFSHALESTLKKAYDQGILLVAAAGNKGDEGGKVEYPAAFSTVIAVGATDKEDKRASFSAQGQEVEVSAPGTRIYSTYLNGRYEYSSGTSMAAPHVVGHLALLKEANPHLTHTQLRQQLRMQTVDLGTEGRDSEFGFGRIQISATLTKYIEPLSTTSDSIQVSFIDLKENEWYTASIKYLAEQSIIGGYEDNTVRPLNNITRAEATAILTRALKIDPIPYQNIYPDVRSELFAAPAIQAAYSQNLISGFPDKTFRPSAFITRGEVAALLTRAYNIQLATKQNYFTDVKEPYYAAGAINSLTEANLSSGYPDGTFKPQESISRAEFAAFLARIMQKF